MEALKLEDVPNVVAELQKGQSEILALLSKKAEPQPEPDNPLNIDEIATLTGYTKPTLYGYCQKNEMPHHKKNGRLFFFKSEIIDWIKTGKQKTLKELEADAEAYLTYRKAVLSKNKKGLNNGK
ncbi:MAG: helix-turn-helix domain-containing protein [Xanthomarina gelatinilytica]|uniref:helix-turn-helix domain-containing protein n=1 Tax=Xanthomarina gelatinilytica TaxID=1137281 RepID=UPI003A8515A2